MIKDHFEVVSFEPGCYSGSRGNREVTKVASALNQEGLSLPSPSSKILDYLYAVDSVFKTEDADGNEITVEISLLTTPL